MLKVLKTSKLLENDEIHTCFCQEKVKVVNNSRGWKEYSCSTNKCKYKCSGGTIYPSQCRAKINKLLIDQGFCDNYCFNKPLNGCYIGSIWDFFKTDFHKVDPKVLILEPDDEEYISWRNKYMPNFDPYHYKVFSKMFSYHPNLNENFDKNFQDRDVDLFEHDGFDVPYSPEKNTPQNKISNVQVTSRDVNSMFEGRFKRKKEKKKKKKKMVETSESESTSDSSSFDELDDYQKKRKKRKKKKVKKKRKRKLKKKKFMRKLFGYVSSGTGISPYRKKKKLFDSDSSDEDPFVPVYSSPTYSVPDDYRIPFFNRIPNHGPNFVNGVPGFTYGGYNSHAFIGHPSFVGGRGFVPGNFGGYNSHAFGDHGFLGRDVRPVGGGNIINGRDAHPVGGGNFPVGGGNFPVGGGNLINGRDAHPVGGGNFPVGGGNFPHAGPLGDNEFLDENNGVLEYQYELKKKALSEKLKGSKVEHYFPRFASVGGKLVLAIDHPFHIGEGVFIKRKLDYNTRNKIKVIDILLGASLNTLINYNSNGRFLRDFYTSTEFLNDKIAMDDPGIGAAAYFTYVEKRRKQNNPLCEPYKGDTIKQVTSSALFGAKIAGFSIVKDDYINVKQLLVTDVQQRIQSCISSMGSACRKAHKFDEKSMVYVNNAIAVIASAALNNLKELSKKDIRALLSCSPSGTCGWRIEMLKKMPISCYSSVLTTAYGNAPTLKSFFKKSDQKGEYPVEMVFPNFIDIGIDLGAPLKLYIREFAPVKFLLCNLTNTDAPSSLSGCAKDAVDLLKRIFNASGHSDVFWRPEYDDATQYSLKGTYIQLIQHPSSGVAMYISQRGLGWKPPMFNRMWERYGSLDHTLTILIMEFWKRKTLQYFPEGIILDLNKI